MGILYRTARSGSVASCLAKTLGGKWTYRAAGALWECDDGVRSVVRVHTGGFDVNGEAMPGVGYYLYGDNEPRRIYL